MKSKTDFPNTTPIAEINAAYKQDFPHHETSNTQPLSIPCDCQHCHELRDKVTRATDRRQYAGTVIADCEHAVDNILDGSRKAIRTNTAITREWSAEVFDAAIRRAAEKSAEVFHGCWPDEMALANSEYAEIIERHIRQELGL